MAHMDIALVEQLIRLFGRKQLDELEYGREGWRVRITRQAQSSAPVTHRAMAPSEPLEQAFTEPHVAQADATPAANRNSVVVASLIGTFYRSPSPGQPAFVQVGDVVEEGQTLGLLEAMKMLNAIEADRSGRISAVCKGDGEGVHLGEKLFEIEVLA